MYMSNPIISPNGKMQWVNDEWIPYNPNQNIIQDSVIMGDIKTEVKYEQNFTTTVNNISHDNELTIRSHLKSMLDQFRSNKTEEGFVILERAKQIDYDLAVDIYNNEFMPHVIESLYQNASNFSYQFVIDLHVSTNSSTRNSEMYRLIQNYNIAVSKINQVLKLDPNHIQSLFILAKLVERNTKTWAFFARHKEIKRITTKILSLDNTHETSRKLYNNSSSKILFAQIGMGVGIFTTLVIIFLAAALLKM